MQFKYGSKIFDKIVDKLQPEFEDETPVNVFDLVEGANFKLKIRKVDSQTNYDKSEFDSISSVKADLNTLESLTHYLDPSNFKTPEELQRRFDKAVGNTVRLATTAASKTVSDDFDEQDAALAQVEKKASQAAKKDKVQESVEDADDIEALMKSLAA
jgi:hypothetical protein